MEVNKKFYKTSEFKALASAVTLFLANGLFDFGLSPALVETILTAVLGYAGVRTALKYKQLDVAGKIAETAEFNKARYQEGFDAARKEAAKADPSKPSDQG